jgi:hypothetical protein
MVLLLVLVTALAARAFIRLWPHVRALDAAPRHPSGSSLPVERLFDAGDVADLERRFREVERDLHGH